MADAVSKLGWDKLRTKSRQSLPDFLTADDDSLPAVLLPHQQAAVQPKAAGDAAGIPTLSQWGLVILASLVGAASLRATSKRG